MNNARLVTTDFVERECGAVFVGIYYFAERYETELDYGLESVAYAAHKSRANLEEFVCGFFYCTVAEERRDEFAASVRLVSAGESTGDEDDLRILD